MTANEWLTQVDQQQKEQSFERLIRAYYDNGHQAAYLALDRMFESSGLLLPWQRETKDAKRPPAVRLRAE